MLKSLNQISAIYYENHRCSLQNSRRMRHPLLTQVGGDGIPTGLWNIVVAPQPSLSKWRWGPLHCSLGCGDDIPISLAWPPTSLEKLEI